MMSYPIDGRLSSKIGAASSPHRILKKLGAYPSAAFCRHCGPAGKHILASETVRVAGDRDPFALAPASDLATSNSPTDNTFPEIVGCRPAFPAAMAYNHIELPNLQAHAGRIRTESCWLIPGPEPKAESRIERCLRSVADYAGAACRSIQSSDRVRPSSRRATSITDTRSLDPDTSPNEPGIVSLPLLEPDTLDNGDARSTPSINGSRLLVPLSQPSN